MSERERADATHRGGAGGGPVPERLARYHQMAMRAGEEGREHVASAWFARMLGIDDSLVRKDLAWAGIIGRPRVGYHVREVLARLEDLLGLSVRNDAVLIGCGHLGAAILGYAGFAACGLKIAAVFDNDPQKVGRTLAGMTILPMEKCRSFLEIFRIEIAILTVPASAARELADWLVRRGIKAIWNFAPVHLEVPPGVVVRDENLALGLARLIHAHKLAKAARLAGAEPAPGAPAAAPTPVPAPPAVVAAPSNREGGGEG